MPPKKVYISPKGKPSEDPLHLRLGMEVAFVGGASDWVSVRLYKKPPFKNWLLWKKTGEKGQPLLCAVKETKDAIGCYSYKPERIKSAGAARDNGPRANPQLIVDGGDLGRRKRKRVALDNKAARRK